LASISNLAVFLYFGLVVCFSVHSDAATGWLRTGRTPGPTSGNLPYRQKSAAVGHGSKEHDGNERNDDDQSDRVHSQITRAEPNRTEPNRTKTRKKTNRPGLAGTVDAYTPEKGTNLSNPSINPTFDHLVIQALPIIFSIHLLLDKSVPRCGICCPGSVTPRRRRYESDRIAPTPEAIILGSVHHGDAACLTISTGRCWKAPRRRSARVSGCRPAP